MSFKFNLVCPRCNKPSETVQPNRTPSPHVNCGDCLMDLVRFVEMKVVSVEEWITAVNVSDRGGDKGVIPWTTNEAQNRRTLLDIADELGVTVMARHPVTDALLMTVSPTRD